MRDALTLVWIAVGVLAAIVLMPRALALVRDEARKWASEPWTWIALAVFVAVFGLRWLAGDFE